MQMASNPFREFAFVSLGANIPSAIGNPEDTLSYAMEKLAKLSSQKMLASSFFETAPIDCPPGSANFVNAVVGIIPMASETAWSLLRKLQQIEKECGRIRSKVLNEARVLDLDLISFRNIRCHRDGLILPHPRASSRRFVLEPLQEIAKDFIIPGQKETLDELLAASLP